MPIDPFDPHPNEKRIKIATNLPEPPEITPELIEKIEKEEKAWSKAFKEQTKYMEVLTPEDLKIVIK